MNDDQKSRELWTRIISAIRNNPKEMVTIRQDGSMGKWFLASVVNGDLLISNAKTNKPSTNIAVERRITEAEFIRTFPYYLRWQNQEYGIRQEAVRLASLNTSYIFALISFYGQQLL